MTYEELIEKIKKLNLKEKRSDTPHLLEIVIGEEEAAKLKRCLKSYYGAPVEDGKVPLPQAQEHIAACGGVWAGQTLYFMSDETHFSYAMLWPWSNGIRITVKLIRAEKNKGNGHQR